jgi:hypothetical protein
MRFLDESFYEPQLMRDTVLRLNLVREVGYFLGVEPILYFFQCYRSLSSSPQSRQSRNHKTVNRTESSEYVSH